MIKIHQEWVDSITMSRQHKNSEVLNTQMYYIHPSLLKSQMPLFTECGQSAV